MTDSAYYEGVIDKMRESLLANQEEPTQWSDGDKLRVLAILFDDADVMRGVLDRHEVQDDLRRMADKLDAPEHDEATARILERIRNWLGEPR